MEKSYSLPQGTAESHAEGEIILFDRARRRKKRKRTYRRVNGVMSSSPTFEDGALVQIRKNGHGYF